MEHTVSNVDTIKNAKPFAELNEEELEKVTGSGAKNTTGKSNTGDVHESLSLNFTKMMFTNTSY
jgi:hypothetical protein